MLGHAVLTCDYDLSSGWCHDTVQVQRMMKSPETSARQAVTKIIRESGLKGLMQGYWITNSIWIPWTSLYIGHTCQQPSPNQFI